MLRSIRTTAVTATVAAILAPAAAWAQSAGWGQVSEPKDEGFDLGAVLTEPLAPGFWMAWTPATALVFVVVFGSIALMGVRERFNPGGHPRRGVLGLDTTRGDRLFLTYLGSAFIFFGWLALMGSPLWGALALAIAWGVFVFWKV